MGPEPCDKCGGEMRREVCDDRLCPCRQDAPVHVANDSLECPRDPFLISEASFPLNPLEPPPRFG